MKTTYFSLFQWERGDVMITDNMALAHRATAEAFLTPDKIGPRVLHRTSTLTSRLPKPVRGFKSAEWEESQKCVKDEEGPCVHAENDNENVEDKDTHKDSVKKDEL